MIIPKKTINEAIVEALKRKNKPLRVNEIYKRISEDDLYRFNAANPEHIVRTQLRRHSENLDFPTANKKKHFLFLTDGTYWNKGMPDFNKTEVDLKTEIIIRKDSENLKSAIEDLKEIHKKHTIAFKQQILNQLQLIDPASFELFGKRLLEVYGFKKMVVTPYIKDGGLDGHGQLKVGTTLPYPQSKPPLSPLRILLNKISPPESPLQHSTKHPLTQIKKPNSLTL